MGANWITKSFFKTIQVGHNNFKFFYIFLWSWNMFKSFAFDFKIYILQIFDILVNQLQVNHKSHVLLSLCFEPIFLNFSIILCMFHTQMHMCFTFSFNNYIFRVNGLFNNKLLIFWNMIYNYNWTFWPTHHDCILRKS